jgi:hypothetical protein
MGMSYQVEEVVVPVLAHVVGSLTSIMAKDTAA